MQFVRSVQCFIRTPRTPDQQHFPDLCAGRWPNLAELVHCPISIVTNSPVLSLGRSTSDPQKALGLCLESSTAAGEEPHLILRDHSRLKPAARSQCSQELYGCTCAHTQLLRPGSPQQRAVGLSLSHHRSQTQQNGPRSTGAEGALDNGVVQELFNTHECNSV